MTITRAPTPRERHLRALLVAVEVRLRRMATDGASMAELRAEATRTADYLRGGLDREGAEE